MTATPVGDALDDLTRDVLGAGDYEVHDGPHVVEGKAVVYLRRSGAWTDIFRVEVTLHSDGSRREQDQRDRTAAAELRSSA